MLSQTLSSLVPWLSIFLMTRSLVNCGYTYNNFEGPVSNEVADIPIPTYSTEEFTKNEQPSEPATKPEYSFSYGVDDPDTGNSQSHSESRSGDVVNGEYTVLEPDGYLRRVVYTADATNGFQATVHYIPPNGGGESSFPESSNFGSIKSSVDFPSSDVHTPKVEYPNSNYLDKITEPYVKMHFNAPLPSPAKDISDIPIPQVDHYDSPSPSKDIADIPIPQVDHYDSPSPSKDIADIPIPDVDQPYYDSPSPLKDINDIQIPQVNQPYYDSPSPSPISYHTPYDVTHKQEMEYYDAPNEEYVLEQVTPEPVKVIEDSFDLQNGKQQQNEQPVEYDGSDDHENEEESEALKDEDQDDAEEEPSAFSHLSFLVNEMGENEEEDEDDFTF